MNSASALRAVAPHHLPGLLLCILLPWNAAIGEAMPVLITVDTETSSGCNGKECRAGPLSDRIYGIQGGRAYGIPLIMDLLEKHGARGTFFVNAYLDSAYPEQDIASMVRTITSRGHDVQFHAHPEFRCFRRCETGDLECRSRCTQAEGRTAGTNFENQVQVLREGALNIERWSGHYPVAFRAGALRADTNTLKALAALNIPIDSSMSGPHHELATVLPVNQLGSYEGVLEIPLLAYGESLPLSRRVRFLDQESSTLQEQKFLLRRASETGIAAVPLIMHSFSFCDPGVACPIGRNIERFDALLGYLANNADRYVVMTMREFWDAYRVNPVAYLGAPSPRLPKVSYWLILQRSVIRFDQGWMNLAFLLANVGALLGVLAMTVWGFTRLRQGRAA